MITITKNGNAVLFEFEENQHYLYNGTIEVPLNSLSLVTDESEMFTFKKAATNDIFISARYDDVNMSKSQLIDFYIANMVGTGGGSESGITSGDVESMIEASLEDYYDIDEIDAALSGKADTSAVTEAINSAVSGKADTSAVTEAITAAVSGKQDTLIAGSGITISGNVISAEGGNLVIELTQAEYDALVDKDPNAFYIITDATEINISDYYTSAQTQSAITAATNALAEAIAEQHYQTSGDVQNAISGKADTSAVYTKSEVDTALSGKQDVSGMTAYTTSSDVESYVSGFTYDKATIDSKVASGGTFDPTNYYDKTATDALLDDKFDASAFTSYSAATDARISEDEEVTAAALNALNDELSGKADSSAVIQEIAAAVSGKQDTLVAGDNITISGNVISAEGGIDSGTVQTMIDGSISGKADSSDVTVAINSAVSGKADSSAVTEISSAVSGKMDTSVFNTYSASTNARISEDEEVTAAALNALNDKVDAIDITVDDALDATSENPVQNKVIYAVIGDIESLLSNI